MIVCVCVWVAASYWIAWTPKSEWPRFEMVVEIRLRSHAARRSLVFYLISNLICQSFGSAAQMIRANRMSGLNHQCRLVRVWMCRYIVYHLVGEAKAIAGNRGNRTPDESAIEWIRRTTNGRSVSTKSAQYVWALRDCGILVRFMLGLFGRLCVLCVEVVFGAAKKREKKNVNEQESLHFGVSPIDGLIAAACATVFERDK